MDTNKNSDLQVIKNFLREVTDHKSETANIRRGRKSTYICEVLDQNDRLQRNDFWFNYDANEFAYGVVGWGICTVRKISDFV